MDYLCILYFCYVVSDICLLLECVVELIFWCIFYMFEDELEEEEEKKFDGYGDFVFF